jgi:cell wall-associated NlpC family hydrolase
MLLTQALKGERITIYDRNGEGFAWGQLNGDGYVGWMPDAALARPAAAPTHKVTALRTFASSRAPRSKLPPVETLPMGARVTLSAKTARSPSRAKAGICRDGMSAASRRWKRISSRSPNASSASPYLWGGKSALGIDCSGLVQVSLNAAGTGCPRDSDMQQDGPRAGA